MLARSKSCGEASSSRIGQLNMDIVHLPCYAVASPETYVAPSCPPVLMLTSVSGLHAAASGYSALATYVPGAERLEVQRQTSTGPVRVVRYALSRYALTNWYQLSSAQLECRAWSRLRNGFQGIVHHLWADSDWGFLDRFADPRKHILCGTFHGAADTLAENIRTADRLKRLNAVIVMSNAQREFFMERGVTESKIFMIPHGVDTRFFRPQTPADTRPFTVLAVGSYRRNFPLMRDVCERLRGHAGIRFRIVARPEYRSFFDGLSNVEFQSGVSDEQLLGAYQQASCLLLTTDGATANNALLEALACGVPVVAEDVGGIREYVSAECAILTQRRNPEALCDAIVSLFSASDATSAMGLCARKRAEEFSWPVIGAQTVALYADLWAARSDSRV